LIKRRTPSLTNRTLSMTQRINRSFLTRRRFAPGGCTKNYTFPLMNLLITRVKPQMDSPWKKSKWHRIGTQYKNHVSKSINHIFSKQFFALHFRQIDGAKTLSAVCQKTFWLFSNCAPCRKTSAKVNPGTNNKPRSKLIPNILSTNYRQPSQTRVSHIIRRRWSGRP
jgi:hypothetical protein